MSNCTNCGSEGAYIGFTAVECSNPACKFHKKEQPKYIAGMDLASESSSVTVAKLADSSLKKSAGFDFKQIAKDYLNNDHFMLEYFNRPSTMEIGRKMLNVQHLEQGVLPRYDRFPEPLVGMPTEEYNTGTYTKVNTDNNCYNIQSLKAFIYELNNQCYSTSFGNKFSLSDRDLLSEPLICSELKAGSPVYFGGELMGIAVDSNLLNVKTLDTEFDYAELEGRIMLSFQKKLEEEVLQSLIPDPVGVVSRDTLLYGSPSCSELSNCKMISIQHEVPQTKLDKLIKKSHGILFDHNYDHYHILKHVDGSWAVEKSTPAWTMSSILMQDAINLKRYFWKSASERLEGPVNSSFSTIEAAIEALEAVGVTLE